MRKFLGLLLQAALLDGAVTQKVLFACLHENHALGKHITSTAMA